MTSEICRVYASVYVCAYPEWMRAMAIITAVGSGLGSIGLCAVLLYRYQRRGSHWSVAEKVSVMFGMHSLIRFVYWSLVLSRVIEDQYILMAFMQNIAWPFMFAASFDYAASIIIAYPPISMDSKEIEQRNNRLRYISYAVIAFIFISTSVLSGITGWMWQEGNYLVEMITLQMVLLIYGLSSFAVAAVVWKFGPRLYRLAQQRADVVRQMGVHEASFIEERYKSRDRAWSLRGRDIQKMLETNERIRSLNRFLIPAGTLFGIILMAYGSVTKLVYETPVLSVIVSAIINASSSISFTTIIYWILISLFHQWKREQQQLRRYRQRAQSNGNAVSGINRYPMPAFYDLYLFPLDAEDSMELDTLTDDNLHSHPTLPSLPEITIQGDGHAYTAGTQTYGTSPYNISNYSTGQELDMKSNNSNELLRDSS